MNKIDKNANIAELQLAWIKLRDKRESTIAEAKRPYDELLEHLEAKKTNVDKDLTTIKSEIAKRMAEKGDAIRRIKAELDAELDAAYMAYQEEMAARAVANANAYCASWNDARRCARLLRDFAKERGFDDVLGIRISDTEVVEVRVVQSLREEGDDDDQ